jgi:hypothetical protein
MGKGLGYESRSLDFQRHSVESIIVSNVNQVGVGLPATGGVPPGGAAATGTAPRLPRFQPPSTGAADSFPSTEGTAILNLTSEQFQGIRKLLIGLRLGRSIADDVRAEIFGILTKGQRRVLGAAWFILSVRV